MTFWPCSAGSGHGNNASLNKAVLEAFQDLVDVVKPMAFGCRRELALLRQGDGPPGCNTGRVGPPDREALGGIAKLFGTSPERVAEMVAADWYGVRTEIDVSDRVLNLSHILDALSDDDAKLVESIARRLAEGREETPDSRQDRGPEPVTS